MGLVSMNIVDTLNWINGEQKLTAGNQRVHLMSMKEESSLYSFDPLPPRHSQGGGQ